MSVVIYCLCALTSIACCVLLARAWRASRHPILFWSALCFAGLSINNVLLALDELVLTQDLSVVRLVVALCAILLLLFGLVWEEDAQ